MSINSVKRALSSLPYTEMKAFGDQVVATLRERAKPAIGLVGIEPAELCDVLATLPLADDKQLETEDTFLSRAFTTTRRGKRTITLRPTTGGWEASTGDVVTVATTVRGAISGLLDHVAAYEALSK